jgi:mycofactocin precursor peptide peptidase
VAAALAELTWQGAARQRGAVLAIPVGATEQHGPHLPLSTDTDIAVALAAGLGAAHPSVLVAPAIAYGSSGEHMDFAGTLSIGRDALKLVILELVRSAARTFARTVLISTHGGNAEPLAEITARLRAESHEIRTWSPRWSGDAHAGRSETSVMLALRPDRVDLSKAQPGCADPVAELLPQLRARGVRAVSDNGILGDPAGASADEGRRLLAIARDELMSAIRHQ